MDNWCYEVPAGGLSPGLPPEQVARRELSEEIGGTAADLRYVGQFYTSNGISNEIAYVFLATGVELGESHPEPTELMEIHLVPAEEALRMAREGKIADGPSALALLWCQPLLRSGSLPTDPALPQALNRNTLSVADLPSLWYTTFMDVQELQDKLSSILPHLEGVCLVYVFGSQVDGNLGPMSDYDLAVLVDRDADARRVQARLAHELACALETDRIDVVLLNRAAIELAYAIIAQGRLLYEHDVATRVDYEAKVLSRYGDFLPMLRRQRKDILRGEDHDQRVRRYRAALGRTERTLSQKEVMGPRQNGGEPIMNQPTVQIQSNCHNCGVRARAEKNPRSLIARLWRWHTNWCPGWKAYVQELQSKGLEVPRI